MATTLNVPSLQASFGWQLTDPQVNGVSDSSNGGSRNYSASLSPGTAQAQADRVYVVTSSLAASTSTEIDLNALTDFFSHAIGFTRVRCLYLEVTTDTLGGSLLVGAAGVQDPTSAPSLSTQAGSLGAGTYKVAYSFTNASGETKVGPTASVTIGGSTNIVVGAITLPAGATGVNYYVSLVANALALALQNGSPQPGTSYTISALPATGNAAVPASNTCLTALSTPFNSTADRVRVRRGGVLFLSAAADQTSYVVTGANGKLRLTNEDSAQPVTYYLGLVGTSA